MADNCPDTKLVLGGNSQGAGVIDAYAAVHAAEYGCANGGLDALVVPLPTGLAGCADRRAGALRPGVEPARAAFAAALFPCL